nr:cyclopropane-fatty-acyl-phospholipid synthase family protein [Motilibacter deserti]
MPREHVLRSPRLAVALVSTATHVVKAEGLGVLRATGAAPNEYKSARPGTHSIEADASELDFHYGMSPEFYRRVLGASMTYSCAIFPTEDASLEQAQDFKHSLVAAKLELDASSHVLDLGCGWGGFLEYVSRTVDCSSSGVTASATQYRHLQGSLDSESARILFGDYRRVLPLEGVTCGTSIGMYEHVGRRNSLQFFELVRQTLPPRGLFLNQSIVRRTGSEKFRRNGFTERFIFPNGHVFSLSEQIRDIERAGMRVLHVETFGEHYARTLSHWRKNLEMNWKECVRLAGEPTVRAWRMYLEGAKYRFDTGVADLAQVLIQRP